MVPRQSHGESHWAFRVFKYAKLIELNFFGIMEMELGEMKKMARALLVVDQDFDVNHVGVRRVINYLVDEFRRAGYSPELATWRGGGLVPLVNTSSVDALLSSKGSAKTKVAWRNGKWQGGKVQHMATPKSDATWATKPVVLDEYLVKVLTNPWLAAQLEAEDQSIHFTFGIAYDMVPNLIAAGVLTFDKWIDTKDFAYAHHRGYEYFIGHTDTILAISENTREDFLTLYSSIASHRVKVFTPFDQGDEIGISVPQSNRILVLNSLDYRKNFKQILESIRRTSNSNLFSIVIVGKERVPIDDVESFLAELYDCVDTVIWYRSMTDEDLAREMQRSALLLFPSIYEGLGLPILEAQSFGLPVISSNVSSCVEANLNLDLQVDVNDGGAIATSIDRVINSPETVISRAKLVRLQKAILSSASKFSDFINFSS